ncbi:MAG: hypothetical protein EA392_00380 [Cryomorphaceae bacterium]|nr:MAG: hypothetical protein EA392_00380 [Cryomorphaceae bacterium]
MNEFYIFKSEALQQFRTAKHPNDLLKNVIFVETITKWYERLFYVKPKISGCGVCLYETFKEMIDMQEKQITERINLPKLIKPGVVVWVDSRPYSRKSPHLTAEIIGKIDEQHLEDNPFFDKVAVDVIEEQPKPKRTRKKKVANGDNSQS